MKNLYKILCLIILSAIVFPVGNAEAASDTSFKIKNTAINTVVNTSDTLFTFVPTEVKNPQNIAYWKIRVSCEDKTNIQVNDLKENVCGKAVKVENAAYNNFLVFHSGSDDKSRRFSLKFKAYDKKGKWLHSDEQSFQWK